MFVDFLNLMSYDIENSNIKRRKNCLNGVNVSVGYKAWLDFGKRNSIYDYCCPDLRPKFCGFVFHGSVLDALRN